MINSTNIIRSVLRTEIHIILHWHLILTRSSHNSRNWDFVLVPAINSLLFFNNSVPSCHRHNLHLRHLSTVRCIKGVSGALRRKIPPIIIWILLLCFDRQRGWYLVFGVDVNGVAMLIDLVAQQEELFIPRHFHWRAA